MLHMAINVRLSSGAVALRSAHFGEGRGPIVIEGAQCRGNEEGLHRCFQTRSQSCSHRNDAAVQCSGLYKFECLK